MPSYRENPTMTQQIRHLLGRYSSKTAIIEAAVALLHQSEFPEDYPAPPAIIGWDRIVLAQPAMCRDTGVCLPIGTLAYREIWSDGRTGAIISREAMIADGIIAEDIGRDAW